MSDNFLYAYCIVRRHSGADVVARYPDLLFIEAGGFLVATKYVFAIEYSDANRKARLADGEWLERNVRKHLSVIEMIMEEQQVIPFNFGTVFKTRESLVGFLGDYAPKLAGVFDSLEGKEEWAVKVYRDDAALLRRLHLDSPAVAALEKEISDAPPGKAYLLKKKKEELLAGELESVRAGHADAVVRALLPLAAEHVLGLAGGVEVPGQEGRLLLNGAFLVPKGEVDAFIRAAEALEMRYREAGLSLDVTGPWPPYDFVNIPF